MLDSEFSIRDEFPTAEYRRWMELVESSLKGKSFEESLITDSLEGISIRPLYVQEDFKAGTDIGLIAGAIENQSTPWTLRQEYFESEPTTLNRVILIDLRGGVESVLIALDRACCRGVDPDHELAEGLIGSAGLMVFRAEDFLTALEGVDLESVSVGLLAGASFLPAAAILIAACQKQGIDPDKLHLTWGGDPLGVLASEGRLPMTLERAFEQLALLAKWTTENSPNSTAVCVDTLSYHEAGASAVQEPAIAMASAAKYLRELTSAGMTIEAAASQIEFRFGLGTNHFTEIAKLRAARLLWAQVIGAFGGDPKRLPMNLHARLGNRSLTRIEPDGNILRNTVAVFAAGLGGADSIASVPFDLCSGDCSDFSRRIARNTAIILQTEAHLSRVIDPARGSWFLETITEDLSRNAWQEFQRIEGQGGIIEFLLSGKLVEEIDAVFEQRTKAYAHGKQAIVGASVYQSGAEGPAQSSPDLEVIRAAAIGRLSKYREKVKGSKSPSTKVDSIEAAIKSATDGATIGQLATALGFHKEEITARRCQQRRFAEPFEADSNMRSETP